MPRTLYGGAIEAVLPASFRDVSDLRQVPDHQEVFVDQGSEASLIVELLSLDADVADEHAVQHYFNQLAEHNEAATSAVLDQAIVADPSFMLSFSAHPRMALVGRQSVPKHRPEGEGAEADDVCIVLVLVRLRDVTTDLLCSLNMPFPSAIAAAAAGEGELRADFNVAQLIPALSTTTPSTEPQAIALQMLRDFVNSMVIKDRGLFC
ncbi:hypothetical protein B484DRAFT_458656 [Ochromonadaceae sp. CCMP2298]|nr:hypothetical protein B484DRAFT_458656 [Ochromonadaceae sp. CCMP2298]